VLAQFAGAHVDLKVREADNGGHHFWLRHSIP
jgi:hypothetical protein